MSFVKFSQYLVLAGVLTGLAACSSTGGSSAEDAEALERDAAAAAAAAEQESIRAREMADQQARDAEDQRLLSTTVFYFDFDQSSVKPSARQALEAHARQLANNSGMTVVLEGHADERGTREYNLALGERRAEAIARYLTVLGVSSQQVETVSYGEERPASVGHNDSAWSQNRRVILKYNR